MTRRKPRDQRAPHTEPLPTVALVGRPNVGKSTLWNRLCEQHHAIVEDEAGVTRDRRYGEAEWEGRVFRCVDTGGLDPSTFSRRGAAVEGGKTIAAAVFRQAMRAVEEADLVVFVIDGRVGLSTGDQEAIEIVRRTGRPVLFAANKVERANLEPEANELYSLGADQVFAISAQHGRGVGELLDAILARLPQAPKVRYLDELDPESLSQIPEARGARPSREGGPRKATPSGGGADDSPSEEAQAEAEKLAAGEDPMPKRRARPEGPIRIGIVGRPNAGKSSLLNRFAGDERVIVDAQAGTTRDPVDQAVKIDGQDYILIDTAGIRRRARVYAPMEKIAVAMAEKAVDRCDVCVLLIDAKEGIGEQDAKIAGLCEEAGRALVIAFNKIDLCAEEGRQREAQLREDVERQLQFVPWAKVVFVSALTGKGTRRLIEAVNAAYAAFTTRVSTGALNRWFAAVIEKHPPSLYRAHPVRMYYIQQPQSAPPTFILSVNHAEGVHFSYRRFLQNQLREAFKLDGTPVRIVCRGRGEQAKHTEMVKRGTLKTQAMKRGAEKRAHQKRGPRKLTRAER